MTAEKITAPKTTWKIFWQSPKNRKYFFAVIAGFIGMSLTVIFTLAHIEKRTGIVIESWAKDIFGQPINFSLGIFSITYFSILFAIIEHAKRPFSLLQVLMAYSIMQIMKCIILFAVPLNPPADILPLNDPILETLYYGGRVNLKDLFFSGHVATVCLAAIFTRGRFMKAAFVILGMLLGYMLAQQRVHYVIDVVAAPLFAWIAYRISRVVAKSARALPA